MMILLPGDVDHITMIRMIQERGRLYDIGERFYLQDEALEGIRIQACRGPREELAPNCHWECLSTLRGNAKALPCGSVYRWFGRGEVDASIFSPMSWARTKNILEKTLKWNCLWVPFCSFSSWIWSKTSHYIWVFFSRKFQRFPSSQGPLQLRSCPSSALSVGPAKCQFCGKAVLLL